MKIASAPALMYSKGLTMMCKVKFPVAYLVLKCENSAMPDAYLRALDFIQSDATTQGINEVALLPIEDSYGPTTNTLTSNTTSTNNPMMT